MKSFHSFQILLVLLFGISFDSSAQLSCSQPYDFTSWQMFGNNTAPSWQDWIIGGGGTAVTLPGNVQVPSFIVGPDTMFNVLIEGRIEVMSFNDDDMIGFVLGWQDPVNPTPNSYPIEGIVFDWKKETQMNGILSAEEGFALYDVDGIFDFDNSADWLPTFFGRITNPKSTLLASNYNNNGWNYYQQYIFQIQYTASSLIVWIDGVEEINISGCFQPGKFGFYGLSQDGVVCSDVTYQYITDFDILNSDVCLGDSAQFIVDGNCPGWDTYPMGTNFTWYFGDGTTANGLSSQSHLYTSPGAYQVDLVIEDANGCTDTTTKFITVHEMVLDSVSIEQPTCGNCNGELTALLTAPSNSIQSYDWTYSNSTVSSPTITNLCPDTYYLDIQNVANCVLRDTITLVDVSNPPIAQFNPSAVQACVDDLLNFTNTSVYNPASDSMIWIFNNGLTSNQVNPMSVFSNAGVYNVELIITDTLGCSDTAANSITINEIFINSMAVVDASCELCNGSITANVDSGFGIGTYNWSGGGVSSSNLQLSNLCSGTYYFEMLDDFGCSITDTLEVLNVGEIPEAILSSNITEACMPGTIEFYNNSTSTSPITSINWDFGDGNVSNEWNTAINTFTNEGLYDVYLQIENSDGCMADTTIIGFITIHPNPIAAFTYNPMEIYAFDPSVNFNNMSIGGFSYQWYFDSYGQSTLENPTFDFPSGDPGSYQVCLVTTNEHGCSDSICDVIEIIEELLYYVPNTFTPDGDDYNQTFQPIFEGAFDPQDWSMNIFNRWGEIVFKSNDHTVGWDGTYGGKRVQQGTYIYKIEFGLEHSSASEMITGHINVIK